MRKTKIVCTIGPASEHPATLTKLAEAGMNVARFNMSHGDHEEHTRRIRAVREVSKKLDKPIGLMLDTKGPEVRVKTFQNGCAEVHDGDTFVFTTEDVLGDATRVSTTYADLCRDLKMGNTVLVNDGLLEFKVKEIRQTDIVCTVVKGGVMSDRKSMNFPKLVLNLPYLSEADKADILFGIEQNVDFIAASFVSCRSNVEQIRDFLNNNGGKHIDIISKIENFEGVKNIDEIIMASDGIMVARGDMGVEIPFEQLPAIQKMMIKKTRYLGRRVITATEMLESMIESPRPTRAETSDVANAVFDGTSAVMLSGETAAGKFPVACVKAMSNICSEAEKNINLAKRFKEMNVIIKNTADAISHATCEAAYDLKAKLIIVFTKSGTTARMVSRFRPETPVIAATFDEKAYTKLTMNWGITPVMTEEYASTDELFAIAENLAKETGFCKSGDLIAVTAGMPISDGEGTNILKIIRLK